MDPTFLKAIADYGIVAGFAIALLWVTMKREGKCEERQASLETFVRGTMVGVIAETNKMLARVEAAIEKIKPSEHA